MLNLKQNKIQDRVFPLTLRSYVGIEGLLHGVAHLGVVGLERGYLPCGEVIIPHHVLVNHFRVEWVVLDGTESGRMENKTIFNSATLTTSFS